MVLTNYKGVMAGKSKTGNVIVVPGKPNESMLQKTIEGHTAAGDGPIKTFPLRGIKDSAPYLHDGRLLTLEDTVEFFNMVLELKLDEKEKKDLVAFLQTL